MPFTTTTTIAFIVPHVKNVKIVKTKKLLIIGTINFVKKNLIKNQHFFFEKRSENNI